METLNQIWQRLSSQGHETDKGSVHSYIPVYEQLLEQYRHTALNVLEIGIFRGDSLRMWAEYFTNAKIYGVDCSLTPVDGMGDLRPLQEAINVDRLFGGNLSRADLYIFDAENVTEVSRRFFDTKFDVIIEDAGHEINQQLNLYRIWSQYLADDGIYIIEDIQDIRNDRHRFYEEIGYVDIHDLRGVKDRYDDVLISAKNYL